jgi:hypothetical protein
VSSEYTEAIRLAKEMYAEDGNINSLAECIYNHVFDAIDFEAMYRFEQVLWCLLPELGIEDEDGEVAEKLVREAIVRAASDPDRHVSHVPPGVTKAEAMAAAFDDGCPLCVLEAARSPQADTPDHVDGECECCDMIARDWRAEHAEVLARAGLGPRLPARPAPS